MPDSGAKQFTAKLDAWVLATKARTDFVIKQSAHDVIQRAQTKAEGENRPGYIPVDTGNLRRSLRSTLYGTTTATHLGEESFIFVAGSMGAGDKAIFDWTADYAAHVEFGTTVWQAAGRPPYRFLGTAAAMWESFVEHNVARAKAAIGGAG